MKKMIQIYYKRVLAMIMTSLLFITGCMPVMAKEIVLDEESIEHWKIIDDGSGDYIIVNESGDVIGYARDNTNEEIMPHSSDIIFDVSVLPGYIQISNDSFILGIGSSITVNVSQSPAGNSYIVIQRASDGALGILEDTITTHGWNYTITFTKLPTTAYYCGIYNASLGTIHYTGTISII